MNCGPARNAAIIKALFRDGMNAQALPTCETCCVVFGRSATCEWPSYICIQSLRTGRSRKSWGGRHPLGHFVTGSKDALGH